MSGCQRACRVFLMELAHVHPVLRACRVFLMKLAHVHPVLTSSVRNAMCIQQLPRPLVYRYDMQATSCQGTSYDYTTAAAAYCSIAMLPAVSVGHDCKHYQVLAVSACLFTVDTYSYFGVHVHTLYWQCCTSGGSFVLPGRRIPATGTW